MSTVRRPELALVGNSVHAPVIQGHPTKSENQRHFDAALGYLNLGMAGEANNEIEALSPEVKTSREVLSLRASVYMEAGSWELLREVSTFLVKNWPGESLHWVWLGFATRRCLSIADAEQVLQEALSSHPAEPLIHFNLACYAAQTGNLGTARERLGHAIDLNPNVRKMALDDPDLEPLWAGLGKPSPAEPHD